MSDWKAVIRALTLWGISPSNKINPQNYSTRDWDRFVSVMTILYRADTLSMSGKRQRLNLQFKTMLEMLEHQIQYYVMYFCILIFGSWKWQFMLICSNKSNLTANFSPSLLVFNFSVVPGLALTQPTWLFMSLPQLLAQSTSTDEVISQPKVC